MKSQKKKRYLLSKVTLSLVMALTMVIGTSSNAFHVKAASVSFDELVSGETFELVYGKNISIFDILKARVQRLEHLDNGSCFTNLRLNHVNNSNYYYSINGGSLNALHGGTAQLRISGDANCGQHEVVQSGIDTVVAIRITRAPQVYPPEVPAQVKAVNAPVNGAKGTLIDVKNSSKLEYAPKGSSNFTPITNGSAAVPRGEYSVRFAGNIDYDPSPSVTLTIMEPNVTPINAPTVTSKTDTTITVRAEAGLAYSVDQRNWFTDGVINGLTPNTNYNVFSKRLGVPDQYYQDSEISFARSEVKTKQASSQAGQPIAPVIISNNDTEIRYNTVVNQEYSLDQNVWIDGDGLAQQYSSLTPDHQYTIYTRIKETADTMPSIVASTDVKTKKDINSIPVPAKPVITNRTDTSITITNISGLEYSINGGAWHVPANGKFTGLTPDTLYTISTRSAETDDAVASKTASTDAKTKIASSSVAVPNKAVVNTKSDVTITVDVVEGNEYRINSGAWIKPADKKTLLFDGLTQNTTYTIDTRVAETDTAMPSAAVSMSTKTKVASNFVTKPSPVTIISKTDKTLTLDVVAGHQYAISGPGLDSNKWYTPGVDFMGKFGDLRANTDYIIKTRTIENNDEMPSLPVDTNVKTKIATVNVPKPAAPVIVNTTDSTLTVTMVNGVEYSVDGINWVSKDKTSFDGIFKNLDENKEITVYARTAETETAMESASVSANATTMCKISGTVTSNDKPVIIKILNKDTGEVIKTIHTNGEGAYTAILPANEYNVVMESKDGYESLKDVLKAPATGAVNYTLKSGMLLNGNVMNGNKETVANIELSLYDANGKFVADTTSNSLGKYYFDGIKDGVYKMTGAGFDAKNVAVSVIKTLVIEDGKVIDADLNVMNGMLLLGGAVTNKGSAIPNASVNVLDIDGKIIASTKTDAKGNYFMISINEGRTIEFTDPTSTATRVEEYKYVPISSNLATAVMSPAAIDMSKEIAREEFIKAHLTKNNVVITERTKDNYAQILSLETVWNELSDVEKVAINKLLTDKYDGQTYQVLLADSKELVRLANTFINDKLTDKAGVIISANENNYDIILKAEAVWDKLDDMVQSAINDTLLAANGKHYTDLLKDANVIEKAVKAFIANNATLNNTLIKSASSLAEFHQILASENAWNQLTSIEKAVVNAKLIKEGGKTFDDLLIDVKAINKAAKTFVDSNATINNALIKSASSLAELYQILASEGAWNKLTTVEKAVINEKLVKDGGKTFDDLLIDVKAINKAAEAFFDKNVTLDNAIIKDISSPASIRQILAFEGAWNKLSEIEKAVVNANLLKNSGKTFDELLKDAKMIDESTNNFLDDNMKDLDQLIKDITNGNYELILASEEAWNKLSDTERAFINDKLLEAGSKTYEELLEDAKKMKAATTGDTTNMAGFMFMMSAAGVCLMSLKKKKRKK